MTFLVETITNSSSVIALKRLKVIYFYSPPTKEIMKLLPWRFPVVNHPIMRLFTLYFYMPASNYAKKVKNERSKTAFNKN